MYVTRVWTPAQVRGRGVGPGAAVGGAVAGGPLAVQPPPRLQVLHRLRVAQVPLPGLPLRRLRRLPRGLILLPIRQFIQLENSRVVTGTEIAPLPFFHGFRKRRQKD
jgi:hypothetical protein